jgi:hypothetical protein
MAPLLSFCLMCFKKSFLITELLVTNLTIFICLNLCHNLNIFLFGSLFEDINQQKAAMLSNQLVVEELEHKENLLATKNKMLKVQLLLFLFLIHF